MLIVYSYLMTNRDDEQWKSQVRNKSMVTRNKNETYFLSVEYVSIPLIPFYNEFVVNNVIGFTYGKKDLFTQALMSN